jgi:phospholipid-binding lipoprotein MlaA
MSAPVRTTAAALVLAAALGGCASVPATGAGDPPPPSPQDPWERWNRGVFAFNEALDKAIVAPVARGYRDVVPELVRTWVGNFFGHVGDAWSAVNHLLQGKPGDALHMGMRFGLNTVFGFAGLIDIASSANLERRSEDFGQTLGRWGLGPGPYVVLPLLGPSTLRDTAGLVADAQASAPMLVFSHASDRTAATVLDVVHRRSTLLGATQLLDEVALDRYQFVRDAYLQRRRNLVYDGNPPPQHDGFDYDEDNGAIGGSAPTPPAAVPVK